MEKILLFEDNVKIKATKTSNLVGSEALTLTAVEPGTAGNNLLMVLTNNDGQTTPNAVYTANNNTVTVLADLDTANATVTKIVAAINASATASKFVFASGTGTTNITAAITGTNFQLSGGVDEKSCRCSKRISLDEIWKGLQAYEKS